MPRARHRRRRRGMRLVLLLAISVCVASIVDFGYNAYRKTNFATSSYHDPLTGRLISGSYKDSGFADGAIGTDFDLEVQRAGAVALLALAVAFGVSVKLAKIHHRRKRLLFATEAVVVTLLLVAGLEWVLWDRPKLAEKFGESTDERPATLYETTPHTYWPPEITTTDEKSPRRK